MRARRQDGFTIVELLVVIAIIAVLAAILLPAINGARASARRSQCANNVRQIALAILSYEAQYQKFPPAVTGSDTDLNKFSMYAFLLPFMEFANAYDKIDFNQDWDATSQSEDFFNNLNLSDALVCPSAPTTRTRYRSNAAVETVDASSSTLVDYVPIHSVNLDSTAGTGAFEGVQIDKLRTLVASGAIKNDGRRGPYSSDNTKWWGILRQFNDPGDANIRPAHVRDGMSSTILMTETSGRPQGYVQGNQKTTQQISGYKWFHGNVSISVNAHCSGNLINCTNTSEVYGFHPQVAVFAHADGSTHFRSDNMDPEVFISLYTMAGGELVSDTEL